MMLVRSIIALDRAGANVNRPAKANSAESFLQLRQRLNRLQRVERRENGRFPVYDLFGNSSYSRNNMVVPKNGT